MLRLKKGVRLYGIAPEMAVALGIISQLYMLHGDGTDAVVTCAVEGDHMRGSLHYVGRAVDIRTKNLPNDETKEKIAKLAQRALREDFDVVLESDHLHVEYQPKTPINS